jgi:hypothetical protein
MDKKTDVMTNAILDVARAYGLGTPQSRAIITALEHGRIKAGLCPSRTQ